MLIVAKGDCLLLFPEDRSQISFKSVIWLNVLNVRIILFACKVEAAINVEGPFGHPDSVIACMETDGLLFF